MDSVADLRPRVSDRFHVCGCGSECCSDSPCPTAWLRLVKGKHGEFIESEGLDVKSVVRVGAENEIAALREMVGSQQQIIEEMSTELDEERNASSSAANEAMSMILRLQREKAEIQMEANQFRRFTEEKMGHDQQEMTALEELLFKREQTIQSLTCEVQAYKHRMMSFGLTEAEADGKRSHGPSRNSSFTENNSLEDSLYDYPPLKCNMNETDGTFDSKTDDADVDKHACGETPREELKHLECRILQIERTSSMNQANREKNVVRPSPRQRRHSRMHSNDSSSSIISAGKNDYPRPNSSFKKTRYFPQVDDHSSLRVKDNASYPVDDMSDRVYTINSVDDGAKELKPVVWNFEDYMSTLRESIYQGEDENPDIKKLYARLQALEADRESMRQAIISMRTDNAHLILLKEIAQHLCKDVQPRRHVPLKNHSPLERISSMSTFKWIGHVVFWRKKALRNGDLFGLSAKNRGLLLLLDKGPRTVQMKCRSRTPA